MRKTGIIAGSGFYNIEGVQVKGTKKITTPYGDPSDVYRICEFSGVEFAFLSRHGTPHHIPPHKINYRANLWGFRELGIERILAVNSVGGINPEMKPGNIVIPDQIIDMTNGRASTFYETDEVVHIDFSAPYCSEVNCFIAEAAGKTGNELKRSGTYLATNGPRLETAAEIRFFGNIGGDMVGMTGMPEACLARELGICFSCIAVITNHAAGISAHKLTVTEVIESMHGAMERVRSLLMKTLELLPSKRTCECAEALKDARL